MDRARFADQGRNATIGAVVTGPNNLRVMQCDVGIVIRKARAAEQMVCDRKSDHDHGRANHRSDVASNKKAFARSSSFMRCNDDSGFNCGGHGRKSCQIGAHDTIASEVCI